MVRIILPWVIATEVRTKNLLFKEADSEHFKVRNLADSVYKSVNLAYLKPFGSIIFQSDATIDTRGNVAGYVGLRSYDGSAYQTTINLKGGLAELSRCKLTGSLDCNSQVLSNGNFQGAHKLVGLSPDLWRNMGPFVYNNHFMPANMLEYTGGTLGTITWGNDYLGYTCSSSTPDNITVIKRFHGLSGEESWDKDRYFGARIYANPGTGNETVIGSGNINCPAGANINARHIGFYIAGTNLYPTVGNGTNETRGTAVTISAQYLRLEAVLHASNDTVDFYKDGSFLQTLSTNVPNGTTDAGRAWQWGVREDTALGKSYYLYAVRVYQEP